MSALGDREAQVIASRPDPEEGARIASTLGVLLRELRREHGLGTRALAERAAVRRNTIVRLERGERRPRRSLLAALAGGLDPDRREELLGRLVDAAGPSLVPESRWSQRTRRRRVERGVAAGAVALPGRVAERIQAHRAADATYAAALRLLARQGAGEDPERLAEGQRLLAEARRLREVAGPPVVVVAGGRRVGYGWRFP